MADVTVNLDGVAGTGSPGTLTETGSANVSPTGVAATSSPGSPSITGAANVTLSGRAGTSHAGSPIVLQDTEVLLLGQQVFADPGVLFNNLVPAYMCCEGPYRLLSIFRARIPIPTPPPLGCLSLAWSYESQVTTLSLHCLSWSAELGIMVAGGNASNTATSPDGVNWTAHTAVTNAATNGIAWSADLGYFLGVGQVGRTRTSTNGVSWTENTPVSGSPTFNSVAWSPELGLFAATRSTATSICVYTSPTGASWTPISTPVTTQSCRNIIWVPPGVLSASGMFVICGSLGLIMTSTDGASFTIQTTPDSTTLWTSIAYSPTLERLMAVTSTRTATNNRTMSSIDGATWVFGSVPAFPSGDYSFSSIAWNPILLMFAMVGVGSLSSGNDGVAAHSLDGDTIVIDSAPSPNRFDFVGSADELALFVGINQVDSGGGFILAVCDDA